jgi:hypothetical protein
MSDFTRVCKASDILDPGKAMFEVVDQFVVVLRAERQFNYRPLDVPLRRLRSR